MAQYQDLAPSLDKFNPYSGSMSATRPWDGTAARYNAVTVGSPLTIPGSSSPEVARALHIGTGNGTVTLRMCSEIGATADVVFQAYEGHFLPVIFTQVVAASGVSNLVWVS